MTALHYAAKCKFKAITKILLDTGADFNIENANGETAKSILEKTSDKKLRKIFKGIYIQN